MTDAQKKTMEGGAAMEGRTVTDFSTDALGAQAEHIVQRDCELRADADRFDGFLEIMDRPERLIDGLRDLMGRKSVFVESEPAA